MTHDGLNPAHVPYRQVNNPTLWDFYDRKSRHRRIKKQRRSERLAVGPGCLGAQTAWKKIRSLRAAGTMWSRVVPTWAQGKTKS